jgi:hypothetical protein
VAIVSIAYNQYMGPIEYNGLDNLDPGLLAMRETFSQWDIYRAPFGYLAVPAGAVVYMAADTDSMKAKLTLAENERNET